MPIHKSANSGPKLALDFREGPGILPLPEGGYTAPHTAKQEENAQEDNGIENSLFFVLHIKS